jgi:Protein of unknown function (DUF3306)
MSEGFLRRWATKKADAAQLTQAEAKAPTLALPATSALPAQIADSDPSQRVSDQVSPPLPTLEDALQLTNRSDFLPFMREGVTPAARNAALKTLFTDPQFNVMDMMDIYVDDYSKPDPIPDALLRMLNQSMDLGLFAKEPEQETDSQAPQETLVQASDVEPRLPSADAS